MYNELRIVMSGKYFCKILLILNIKMTECCVILIDKDKFNRSDITIQGKVNVIGHKDFLINMLLYEK